MDTWMWVMIAAFIAVDCVATFFIVRSLNARKRSRSDTSPESVARDLGLGPDA